MKEPSSALAELKGEGGQIRGCTHRTDHSHLGTDPGSTHNPVIWSRERILTCGPSHWRHPQLTCGAPQTCAHAVLKSAGRSWQRQRRQLTNFRFTFTILHPKSVCISRDLEHVYTFYLSTMSHVAARSASRGSRREQHSQMCTAFQTTSVLLGSCRQVRSTRWSAWMRNYLYC